MKKDKTQNGFILIKKYSNRRLYNSSKSKYINFKELFELIKNNIDFKIEDHKTGEDLTQEILLQTIFEFKNTSKNVFTVSFIKKLFLIDCFILISKSSLIYIIFINLSKKRT